LVTIDNFTSGTLDSNWAPPTINVLANGGAAVPNFDVTTNPGKLTFTHTAPNTTASQFGLFRDDFSLAGDGEFVQMTVNLANIVGSSTQNFAGLALDSVSDSPTTRTNIYTVVAVASGAIQAVRNNSVVGQTAAGQFTTGSDVMLRMTRVDATHVAVTYSVDSGTNWVAVPGIDASETVIGGFKAAGAYAGNALSSTVGSVYTFDNLLHYKATTQLQVNRATGQLTLVNSPTGDELQILGYSITSAFGALDPGGWKTIAGHYDSAGDGSVDDEAWSIQTQASDTLAEVTSGAGGSIDPGQSVALSLNPANGPWVQSYVEDLKMQVTLAGLGPIPIQVVYTGTPIARGDFDGDGSLTATDYMNAIAANYLRTGIVGTPLERYLQGDMDSDADVDIHDYAAFRSAYDAAHGAGAFAAMVASVPEPTAATLLCCGLAAACGWTRRRSATPTRATVGLCHRAAAFAFALLGLAATASVSQAVVVTTIDSFTSETLDAQWNTTSIDNVLVNGGAAVPNFSVTTNPGKLTFTHTAPNTTASQFALMRDDFKLVGPGESVQVTVKLNSVGATAQNLAGLVLDHTTDDPNTRDNLYTMVITGGGVVQVVRGNTIVGATASAQFTAGSDVVLRFTRIDATHVASSFSLDNGANFVTFPTTANAQFTNPIDNNERVIGGYLAAGVYSGNALSSTVGASYLYDDLQYVTTGVALRVNQATGEVKIVNTSSQPIDMSSYQINSPLGRLLTDNLRWSSLDDRNLDPIGGGNDPGENWIESANASANAIGETFLLGGTMIAPGASLSLGTPYDPGVGEPMIDADLAATIYDATQNLVLDARVEFITGNLQGDYNADGRVDAADYVVWRQDPAAHGGNPQGYNTWRQNFGSGPGSGSALGAGAAAVPEPASAVLSVVLGLACLAIRPKRRK
jgi:hypothetical protein